MFLRLLEEQGVVVGYECQYKRKDGSTIWVSLNCRKVLDADGRSLIDEGFIEDITERRRTVRTLQESEARFRSFFSESASVRVLEPSSGAILAANRAALQFYGIASEQLIGMSIDRINSLPAENVAQERDRALARGADSSSFRHRVADSRIRRDWKVSSSPIQVDGASCCYPSSTMSPAA